MARRHRTTTGTAATRMARLVRQNRGALLRSTALQAAFWVVLTPAHAEPPANARPQGGQVVAGSAAIVNTPAATTINQSTPRAAIDWKSFDVGSQHLVQFNQPTTQSVTLNRVLTQEPSQIAGRINANGTIVIVNGSGVVFSQGAQVNANGVLITTADTSNQNLMAGKLVFDKPGKPGAMVINQGTITVGQAGLAALVAPGVANSGTINARMGKVILAGAEAHTVDLYGDGLMSIDVSKQVGTAPVGPDGKPATALVTNSGVINAEGGQVVLTAAAADGIVTTLVNAGGRISADTAATGRTGAIVMRGVGGSLTIEGAVSAQGTAPGTTGGRIEAAASGAVTVKAGATINASGRAGGGTVALGTTITRATDIAATAQFTSRDVIVERMGTVLADATERGNGGRVVLLSTEQTAMQGSISARGGAAGGNGGFIEVSGYQGLSLGGAIDVSAAAGAVGSILIDPTNITITSSATSGGLGLNPNDNNVNVTTGASPSNANIRASDLNSFTGNTTLQATSDITISNAVTSLSSSSLTLLAGGDININAAVGFASPTGGNLVLNATGGTSTIAITSPMNAGTAGTISLSASGTAGVINLRHTLTAASANLTASSISLASNSAAGLVTIAGAGTIAVKTDSLAAGNNNGTLSAASGVVEIAPFSVTALAIASNGNGTTLGVNTTNLVYSAGTLRLGSAGGATTANTVTTSGNLDFTAGGQSVGTLDLVGGTSITITRSLKATSRVSASSPTFNIADANGTLVVGNAGTVAVRTDAFVASVAGALLNAPSGVVEFAPRTVGNTVTLGAATATTVALGAPSGSGTVGVTASTLRIGATGGTITAGSATITAASDLTTAGIGRLDVQTTGTVTQAAAAGVTVGTLDLAAASANLNDSTNAVSTLGTVATSGDFVLANGGALAIAGPVATGVGAVRIDAGANLLTSTGTITGGSATLTGAGITLGGSLGVTGAATLDATTGTLGLNGSVTGASGALSGVGVTLAGVVNFGTAGPVGIAAGAGTLAVTTGTLTAGAAVLSGASIALGGALNIAGALTTNSTGAVSGTGVLAAGTLTGTSLTNFSLTGNNTIGTLGDITVTTGDFVLANNGAMTVAGRVRVLAAGASIRLADASGIVLGAVSAGTLEIPDTGTITLSTNSLTAGAGGVSFVSATTGTVELAAATLTNSLALGGTTAGTVSGADFGASTFAPGTALRIGTANGATQSGAINVAGTTNLSGAATLDLRTTGTIGQTATLQAALLTGSAADVNLPNAGNVIGALSGMTATGGNLVVASSGAMNVSGTVSSTNAGASSVRLTGAGTLAIAAATTISVNGAGTISLVSDNMTVGAGVTLGTTGVVEVAPATNSNTISLLGVSAGSVIAFSPVGLTTSATTLRLGSANGVASAAAATVGAAADVTALGFGTLELHAIGAVTQPATFGITVDTLGVVAASATLTETTNRINTLGTVTTSGLFSLVNGGTLSVAGPVATGTGALVIDTGTNLLSTTGAITGGSATLTGTGIAAGGSLGITNAATLNAGTGTLALTGTLSAGSAALSGTGVTLSGSLNATGASVVNASSGTLSVTGAGTISGGSATLTGAGVTMSGVVGVTGAATLNAGAAALSVPGTISAGSAALNGTGITLGGSLNATGASVLDASSGALSVTGTGTISGGSATLTGAGVTMSGVIAVTGAATLNAGAGILSVPGTIGAGSAALTGTGITLGGSLNATGASVVDALTGALNETGTITGGSATLSGGGVTVGGVLGVSGAAVVTSTAAATISGQATAGSANVSGTVVTVSGSLGVTGAATLAATSGLSVGGQLGAGTASLSGTSVTLDGAVIVTGAASVNATTTAVSQAAGGTLSAGTLTGGSTTTFTLAGSETIGTLGNLSIGSGDFVLNQSAAMTVAGTVQVASGASIRLTGTSGIAMGSAVTAGTLDATGAGTITLQTNNLSTGAAGGAFLGAGTTLEIAPITAGTTIAFGGLANPGTMAISLAGLTFGMPTLRLGIAQGATTAGAVRVVTASDVSAVPTIALNATGALTQAAALTAGTLTGSAASVTLNNAGNNIAALGDLTATAGAVVVTNTAALPVLGNVSGTGVTLSAPGIGLGNAVTSGTLSVGAGGTIALRTDALGVGAANGTLAATGAVIELAPASVGTVALGAVSSVGTLGLNTSNANLRMSAATLRVGASSGTTTATSVLVAGADLSSFPARNATTLDVRATGGVTQTGPLTVDTLTGVAGTITLNDTGNQITRVADLSTTAGGLQITDSVGVTLLGAVGPASGQSLAIVDSAAGGIAVGDAVTAGTLTVAGTGTLALRTDALVAGAAGGSLLATSGVIEIAPNAVATLDIGAVSSPGTLGVRVQDFTLNASTLRLGAIAGTVLASEVRSSGGADLRPVAQQAATLDLRASNSIFVDNTLLAPSSILATAPAVLFGSSVGSGTMGISGSGTIAIQTDGITVGAFGGTISAPTGVMEVAALTPGNVIAVGGVTAAGTLGFRPSDFAMAVDTLRIGQIAGADSNAGIVFAASTNLSSRAATLDLQTLSGVSGGGSVQVATLTGAVGGVTTPLAIADAVLSAAGNAFGVVRDFVATGDVVLTSSASTVVLGNAGVVAGWGGLKSGALLSMTVSSGALTIAAPVSNGGPGGSVSLAATAAGTGNVNVGAGAAVSAERNVSLLANGAYQQNGGLVNAPVVVINSDANGTISGGTIVASTSLSGARTAGAGPSITVTGAGGLTVTGGTIVASGSGAAIAFAQGGAFVQSGGAVASDGAISIGGGSGTAGTTSGTASGSGSVTQSGGQMVAGGDVNIFAGSSFIQSSGTIAAGGTLGVTANGNVTQGNTGITSATSPVAVMSGTAVNLFSRTGAAGQGGDALVASGQGASADPQSYPIRIQAPAGANSFSVFGQTASVTNASGNVIFCATCNVTLPALSAATLPGAPSLATAGSAGATLPDVVLAGLTVTPISSGAAARNLALYSLNNTTGQVSATLLTGRAGSVSIDGSTNSPFPLPELFAALETAGFWASNVTTTALVNLTGSSVANLGTLGFGYGATSGFSLTNTAPGGTLTVMGGQGPNVYPGVIAWRGNAAINETGNVAILGPLGAGGGNLGVTASNISVGTSGVVSAGGTLTLGTGGTYSQSGGLVNAPVVSISATGGATLTGGAIAASSNIESFLARSVIASGLTPSITINGSLAMNNGSVVAVGGGASINVTTLNQTAGTIASAGVINVGTGSGGAGTATGSASAGGSFLQSAGVLAAAGDVTIFTTGNLIQTAGTIAAGGTLAATAQGSISQGNTGITSVTTPVAVMSGGAAVRLFATTGSASQGGNAIVGGGTAVSNDPLGYPIRIQSPGAVNTFSNFGTAATVGGPSGFAVFCPSCDLTIGAGLLSLPSIPSAGVGAVGAGSPDVVLVGNSIATQVTGVSAGRLALYSEADTTGSVNASLLSGRAGILAADGAGEPSPFPLPDIVKTLVTTTVPGGGAPYWASVTTGNVTLTGSTVAALGSGNFGYGATGSFALTNAAAGGTLTVMAGQGGTVLPGVVAWGGTLSITESGAMAVQGPVSSATGNATLTSTGDMALSGAAVVAAAGTLTLTSSGVLSQSAGRLNAPVVALSGTGGVTLSGGAIAASPTIESFPNGAASNTGLTPSITIGGGALSQSGGTVGSSGALTIGSASVSQSGGAMAAGGAIAIGIGTGTAGSAGATPTGTASLTQTGGASLVAGGDLTIFTTGTLTQTAGAIAAGGTLAVTTGGALTQGTVGAPVGAKVASMSAPVVRLFANSGAAQQGGDAIVGGAAGAAADPLGYSIRVQSPLGTNSFAFFGLAGAVTPGAAGTLFMPSSNVTSAVFRAIPAPTAGASAGPVTAGNADVALLGDTIAPAGGTITARNLALYSRNGASGALNATLLTGRSGILTQDATNASPFPLPDIVKAVETAGLWSTASQVTANATHAGSAIANLGTAGFGYDATGSLTVGNTAPGGVLTIMGGQGANVYPGVAAWGGALAVTEAGAVDIAGPVVGAGGNARVQSGGTMSVGSSGVLAASATLDLVAGGAFNLTGGLANAPVVNVSAPTVILSGGAIAASASVQSFPAGATFPTGLTPAININATGAFSQSAGVVSAIGATATVTVTPLSFTQTGGTLSSGGTLRVGAGSGAGTAAGSATGNTAFTQSAGTIAAVGDVTLFSTGTLAQSGGAIAAGGTLAATVTGNIAQTGGLLSGGQAVRLFSTSGSATQSAGTVAGPQASAAPTVDPANYLVSIVAPGGLNSFGNFGGAASVSGVSSVVFAPSANVTASGAAAAIPTPAAASVGATSATLPDVVLLGDSISVGGAGIGARNLALYSRNNTTAVINATLLTGRAGVMAADGTAQSPYPIPALVRTIESTNVPGSGTPYWNTATPTTGSVTMSGGSVANLGTLGFGYLATGNINVTDAAAVTVMGGAPNPAYAGIQAGGTLSLATSGGAGVTVAGPLAAAGNLSLSGGAVTVNNNAVIASGATLGVTASGLLSQSAGVINAPVVTLAAAGGVTLSGGAVVSSPTVEAFATGTPTNTGLTPSINVSGGALTLSGGTISGTGTGAGVTLLSSSVTQSAGVLSSDGAIVVGSGSGAGTAAGNATGSPTTGFSQSGGTMVAAGDLTLQINGTVSQTGGTIAAGGTLASSSTSLAQGGGTPALLSGAAVRLFAHTGSATQGGNATVAGGQSVSGGPGTYPIQIQAPLGNNTFSSFAGNGAVTASGGTVVRSPSANVSAGAAGQALPLTVPTASAGATTATRPDVVLVGDTINITTVRARDLQLNSRGNTTGSDVTARILSGRAGVLTGETVASSLTTGFQLTNIVNALETTGNAANGNVIYWPTAAGTVANASFTASNVSNLGTGTVGYFTTGGLSLTNVAPGGTLSVLTGLGAAVQPGIMALNGAVVISDAGAVDIQGSMASQSGNVTVTAGTGLSVSGGLNAGGAIALSAGGALSVSGPATATGSATLSAGGDMTLSNTLTAGGSLGATAAGTLSASGPLTAGAGMTLSGATGMTLGGALAVTGNLALTTSAGPMVVNGAANVSGNATLASTGDMTLSNTLTAGGSLGATATGTLTASGPLTAGAGMTLSGATGMTLTGALAVTGNLALSTSAGPMAVNGPATVSGGATLASAGAMTLGNTLTAGGSLGATATGALSATGPLTAGAGMTISGGTGLTLAGALAVTGNLALTTVGGPMVVSGPATVTGNVTLGSTGAMTLSNTMGVGGSLAATSTGTLASSGAITVATTATLSAGTDMSVGGTLTTGGDLSASATGALTVRGSMIVGTQGGTIRLGAATVNLGAPGAPATLSASHMLINGTNLVTASDGTTINTGGDVFTRPALGQAPAVPNPLLPGTYITTGFGGFTQTGQLNVNSYVATNPAGRVTTIHPVLSIKLSGQAGAITLDATRGVIGTTTALLLDIGAGSVSGAIDVDTLALYYTSATGPQTQLFGTLRNVLGVAVTGGAAASQAFISNNGNFVPSSHFQMNGCALTSVNCVLTTLFPQPAVSNPFKDLVVGRLTDPFNDPDLLLPNVSDRDY